jgi:hypothetical protein
MKTDRLLGYMEAALVKIEQELSRHPNQMDLVGLWSLKQILDFDGQPWLGNQRWLNREFGVETEIESSSISAINCTEKTLPAMAQELLQGL